MNSEILELFCAPCRNITPIEWKQVEIKSDDFDWVKSECSGHSDFDPKSFRNQMFQRYTAGSSPMICWQSGPNRIIVIGDEKPDNYWSLAIQLFKGKGASGYRILWVAHPESRQFPEHGKPLGPISVNGGYTYPCSNNSIVVYRKEEGLRVLIHELLHASCTDNMKDHLPIMEAKTEAWAELIYCSLIAKGNLKKALRLWDLQAGWVIEQSLKLRRDHGVNQATDYAWRYTVGKAEYLKQWGLLLTHSKVTVPLTTRLTHPLIL